MNRRLGFCAAMAMALGVGPVLANAQETVSNNAASGAGSFSDAITTANSNSGSTITFSITGSTIDQNVALPTLTVPTTINGGTGNTVQGDGVTPTLNVNITAGSGAFTLNSLALTGSVGTSGNGTNANGTGGTTGTAGGTGTGGTTGGAGGVGLQTGAATTVNLTGTITGGVGGSANGGSANGGSSSGASQNGGAGGIGGAGGTAGAGGTGVFVSGSGITITNNGTIFGGTGGSANGGNANGGSATGSGANGGNGGTGGHGGTAGNGGAGVLGTGSSFTLVNTGTISVGAQGTANGGTAIGGSSSNGSVGINGTTGTNGGVGVGVGAVMVQTDAATIIDSGTISGNGVGDAIDFHGTNNTLQLQAGYSIVGNVFADQSGNLLQLGGSADASLDVSRLDQSGANQFLNIVNFEKTGTSTWTLVNTATRATNWFIDQGVLEVTSDGALGTGNSVVLRGGELLTDQTGGFSTTRTINLQGNGTIAAVLGTNPNYFGIVTIQTPGTDTLTIGDAVNNASIAFRNTIQDGAGTLSVNVVNGTLSMDGSNTYSGGTTISGADTIVISNTTTGFGSGALTMNAGILHANGGSLHIGALNGTGGFITSSTDATLFINDNLSPAQTFAGTIEDSDATILINKLGTGTEIFTGSNTYTGGTTLAAGTLAAGNAQAFGTGSFSNTGGTLEMAGTNHVLNLGSYTQGAGGTTSLYVLSPTSNDRINVTNSTDLHGTLNVDLGALNRPGTPALNGASFTVLTTDSFTSIASDVALNTPNAPAGTTASLIETSTEANLILSTSATFFPTTGLNGNQQAIAGAINQNLQNGNTSASFTTLDTALVNLYAASPGGFANALNLLSAQAFGQFAESNAFNNASFSTEALDNYLANQRGANGNFVARSGGLDSSGLVIGNPAVGPSLAMVNSHLMAWSPSSLRPQVISDTPGVIFGGTDMKDTTSSATVAAENTNPWNVFISGNVILAQGSSSATTPHFGSTTESVTLGADYRLTPHFLVGATLGYAHSDADLDEIGSSATVDSYSPGFYASYADRGWYANFVGNYIRNSYTQDRQVSLLNQTASSVVQGNEGVVDLDGGYDFHRGALTFGPLAGLQYTHLAINGYQEYGSAADLSVNEQEQDSLRSRLGGRVSYAFNDGGVILTPHLDASWQHEFLAQSRGITTQFGFGGGSFDVRTDNPSRDSALVDIGLDADLNRTIKIFGDYEVQAGQENYFGQSIQGGVKIGF